MTYRFLKENNPRMKGGIDMKNIANMESLACAHSCYEVFRECLSTGEDESVCRIQKVPCDCSCSDDELVYASYIGKKLP
jgi:hypothetical protein